MIGWLRQAALPRHELVVRPLGAASSACLDTGLYARRGPANFGVRAGAATTATSQGRVVAVNAHDLFVGLMACLLAACAMAGGYWDFRNKIGMSNIQSRRSASSGSPERPDYAGAQRLEPSQPSPAPGPAT